MSAESVNLLGLPRKELEGYFADMNEKPFRARQVMRWVYQNGVLDPEEMTDLSQKLRNTLANQVCFSLPTVSSMQRSADGTIKWAIGVGNGQDIETVFIPEKNRGTLCVSSQVGCAMDCPFCATGRQGFNRNLSAAEIIGQVIIAQRQLDLDGLDQRVTNVVFMGMGEPLANIRELTRVCHILTDDLGFALSRRRVTVSTSGLVPQIRKLAEATDVALAISLHAANNELRNELVPINRRHPVEELLEACWDYARDTNAKAITFEYIMLQGVNDSLQDARDLAGLLKGQPAKVNLIPFNPVDGIIYERTEQPVIDAFRKVLLDRGIIAVTRRPRGDDIDAACGQLAGQLENKVRIPLAKKLVHTVNQA